MNDVLDVETQGKNKQKLNSQCINTAHNKCLDWDFETAMADQQPDSDGVSLHSF